MLRATPPGEDDLKGIRARPISVNAAGTPPGEDGTRRTFNSATNQIENDAQKQAADPDGVGEMVSARGTDFLRLVREAEDQALQYVSQVNRKAWSQTYRAFHNEHYIGSKYMRPDWRGRSNLFVPKTRAAVRKDSAATAASLFNSVDAITCLPGNEADPRQRASAAVMQELVNYRTDRSSGKASFPWFLVALGARQDAVLTGICATKQSWKQKHRKVREEKVFVPDEDGTYVEATRDVFALDVDRPDMILIPPENMVMDVSADWTDPVQSAAFFVAKWPMQIEEIRDKQNAPVNPWKQVPVSVLKGSSEAGKFDMAAIRRARELGLDRLDETQTGTHFQIIWVYECFIRVDGEDWTFYSVGDQAFLTDPKPVREVYPEQFGERPITMGYGQMESHRIYPMSPAESWQPLQQETNDLRNLMLDATKQNVMPITKVRRGRQIDLDLVRRRSAGTSIIVTAPDDVTFEPPPQMPTTAIEMTRELDLEFDDLAGQQNYGSVETNNALGKTLGGLKLAAGAANSVQEFDIRVWIETWATGALTQIVRLEQYYESDPVVLGIAGQKAQLFEKYGISHIDDDLLEQDVTVRVSAGLGAGDPQQRLAKFAQASQITAPIIQASPEFQSGQKEINVDAMIEEVFGAVGYKDGGSRFFKDNGQPRQNPMMDLKTQELQAKIAKDQSTGKAAVLTAIASLAKAAIGKRELEADIVDMILGHQMDARSLGHDHARAGQDMHLRATDHGHRHGLELAKHRQQIQNDALNRQAQPEGQGPDQEGGGAEIGGGAAAPSGDVASTGPQDPSSASPPPQAQYALAQLMQNGQIQFTRDASGRISGIGLAKPGHAALPAPTP